MNKWVFHEARVVEDGAYHYVKVDFGWSPIQLLVKERKEATHFTTIKDAKDSLLGFGKGGEVTCVTVTDKVVYYGKQHEPPIN